MVYGPALPPGGLPSGRRGVAAQAADSDGAHSSKTVYGGSSPSPSGSSNGADHYEPSNAWPLEAGRVGCGLHNLGNSCYLNSVLQCLTHLPPLAALACSKYHLPTSCNAGKSENCIFCILTMRIRMSLKAKGGQQPSEPRRLWHRLKSLGRQFEQGRQEDAHELLRCLIDACERDLLKHEGRYLPNKHIPDPNTAVNALFQGTLRSQVKCGACGHESNTYDPFMDLSLDLPAVHSLTDALQRFTAPEHLDAANRYRCAACKGLVPARKQITIHHPPNCLVIHLKRFDPSGFGAKVTRHIQFPETLPLHAYLSHPPSASHLPGPTLRPHPPTRSHPAAPDAHYTLHGVLVHQGFSSHSGHYFAFVRGGEARPSWWCMNDSIVSPTGLDTVKQQQAYMLFYVASHMHPLPPTPPPTPDPAPTTAAPTPAPRPSSPASSTASAPAIGPAPRPRAPAANGTPARVPYGPHLPPAAAPLAAATHPPTPTRPPDLHPHLNGTAAPPSSPPSSPAPPNGNGAGHHNPAVSVAAAATRVQAAVTHFVPQGRRPLTKQAIAAQRTAGAAAAAAGGPPLAQPAVPDAVLRLTQQQPDLEQEGGQQQRQAQAQGEESQQQGAEGGAAGAEQGARGVRENGNGHAAGSGSEPHSQRGHAGAAPGCQQAAPGDARAAAAGASSQLQQQQEQQQANGQAAAAEGAAGGGRGGRKRRMAEVELGQEPAAVEGKREVKQKLLGALRQHPSWMDAVRAHFRRCRQANVPPEEALKAARSELRPQLPAEVKQQSIQLLREVLERAADEATGHPS